MEQLIKALRDAPPGTLISVPDPTNPKWAAIANHEDPRKVGVKKGIRQLKSWQIMRVLQHDKPMAWDDGNYVDGKFCQLAVGIGLHEVDAWPGEDGEPTDELVKRCIKLEGMNPVNTKGIEGEFFTTHRERDFIIAAREVLAERGIYVPDRINQ